MTITFITSQDNWHKGWLLTPQDLQVAINAIEKTGITIQVKDVSSIHQLEKILDSIPSDTVVWSNAYYVNDGKNKVAWLNDYIAERNLPLIGSSSKTLLNILEKDTCQSILQQQQIPIPPHITITRDTLSILEEEIKNKRLKFPMVIKPTTEGGSLGIKLVYNFAELNEQAHHILAKYPESNVIVELFLPSHDITCGYFQLGNEVLLLPTYYLIRNAPGQTHILSRENQFGPWDGKNKVHLFIEEEDILNQIKANIPKIVNTLNIQDLTRIDGRLDSDGVLRFFDINGYPGLRFGKSVLVKQCAWFFQKYSELEVYEALLNTVIHNTLLRYDMDILPSLQSHNLFTMESEQAIKIPIPSFSTS